MSVALLREVSSSTRARGGGPGRRGPCGAGARDVVVDQAPHAAQLAQGVEVAHQRHPRVGVAP